MPGSDRPNVLKIAQSVPGAWPTIPALMRLMSSQATFEPVSAKTQPVSGHTICQIPDIENSCGRDSSRKTPPSVGSARFSSPKTRPLPPNPRKCRHFSDSRKFLRRDPGGWLGRQDSNLGMAESKSEKAFDMQRLSGLMFLNLRRLRRHSIDFAPLRLHADRTRHPA